MRFCVELSEYVPVAANCWVEPERMAGSAGVTEILTSTGAIVRLAVPLMVAKAAEMVADPLARAWASPALPGALPMVAAVAGFVVHVLVAVRSSVLPSE